MPMQPARWVGGSMCSDTSPVHVVQQRPATGLNTEARLGSRACCNSKP